MAWGTSSGGSGWGGSSRPKRAGKPGIISRLVPDVLEKPLVAGAKGYVGLAGNLLGDVKDAVVGLPVGLVTAIKDPVRASKAIAGATWHTWSPLFKGHPLEFAKQTYDHPLAPLLDVASVFTLGAGSVARGAAALEKAGSTSATVGKLSGLRKAKAVEMLDPKGTRAPEYRHYSRRAGRRIVQEGMVRLDPHLPKFYTRGRDSFRYERAHLSTLAHNAMVKDAIHAQGVTAAHKLEGEIDAALAVRLQTETIFEAAHAVDDITETGRMARRGVAEGTHANLIRHNKAYDVEEAARLVGKGHYRYIAAPEYLDKTYLTHVKKGERRHASATRKWSSRKRTIEKQMERLDAERAKLAETAHSEKRIVAELAEANQALVRISDGSIVAGGAKYRSGPRAGEEIANPTRRQLIRYESEMKQEATERVARLERMREESLKAKVRHEEVVGKLDELKGEVTARERDLVLSHDELETLKDRASDSHFDFAAGSQESLVSFFDRFGDVATTRNLEHAVRRGDGKVYIAPKHDAYNLGIEGGNSLKFLHQLVHKPTRLWKRLVIGYTPRVITNNGVGNWMMYAAQELPSRHGLMAMGEAFRWRVGETRLLRGESSALGKTGAAAGDLIFPTNHWLHRWFGDQLADAFGVGNEVLDIGAAEALSRSSWLKRTAKQGFYPATKAIAEDPVRAAVIMKTLRTMPEVQLEAARLRRKGLSRGKAFDRAVDAVLSRDAKYGNGVIKSEIQLQSRRLAGDYVTLSENEKWLRDIIPFYLWNRHILKTSGNMVLNQPGRVAIASRLSALGLDEMQEMYGELPEFMRGAIPLALLGIGEPGSGRANMLLTASLNPWATVGEMAESVEALTVGGTARRGAAFSLLNPFFQAGVESATEKSLLTGALSPREGGLLEDILKRTFKGLPHSRAIEAFTTEDTEKTPKGNDYLYARDDRSQVTSLLGIPIRNVSLARAAALVAENDDKKKKGWGG